MLVLHASEYLHSCPYLAHTLTHIVHLYLNEINNEKHIISLLYKTIASVCVCELSHAYKNVFKRLMNASRCRQRFSNRMCLPAIHNTDTHRNAHKYTHTACCFYAHYLIVTLWLYSLQTYRTKCEWERHLLPVLESLLKSKASTINVYDLWKKENTDENINTHHTPKNHLKNSNFHLIFVHNDPVENYKDCWPSVWVNLTFDDIALHIQFLHWCFVFSNSADLN